VCSSYFFFLLSFIQSYSLNKKKKKKKKRLQNSLDEHKEILSPHSFLPVFGLPLLLDNVSRETLDIP
jgi:hypothetical protein